MSNTSAPAQGEQNLEQEIDQTLEKTNLGHIINENKNLIMILGGVLLAVIIGVSVIDSIQEKKNNKILNEVFSFKTTAVKDLADKKIKPADFAAKIAGLESDVKHHGSFLPVSLEASNLIASEGDYKTAITVLNDFHATTSVDSYEFHLSGLQLATFYENAGENDKAIALLEKMIPSQYHLLLSKIYFDLGRLYLAKGDFNKAKNNFNNVVNGFAKDKVAEYAKIYLKEIEKRARK